MEPAGDPEARIRDLERPLADQALASELGTRPYEATSAASSAEVPTPPPYPYSTPPDQYVGAQHPYASPQYGPPYHSPPQQFLQKRPRTALWLIPLATVIAVLGIGIAVLLMSLSPRGSDTGFPMLPASPGVAGGGGAVDAPEIDVPQIDVPQIDIPQDRPRKGLPVTPDDDVVTVEAGDTVSFGGFEQNTTVVCNQGTVNISGMSNTVEILGDCASVSVSGMNNILTIESAQSITASGFDNQVTFRAGNPEVSKSGSGNVIEPG